MPSKKKKYNARFPAGRIKKIMQTDEEVGKVAQAVPVIISRTLELFVESLLTKTLRITNARNAKTLSPSHMKQCIISESRFDFLRDLVKNIPDIGVNEEQLSGSEAGYGNEAVASPASTSTSSSSNGGGAGHSGTLPTIHEAGSSGHALQRSESYTPTGSSYAGAQPGQSHQNSSSQLQQLQTQPNVLKRTLNHLNNLNFYKEISLEDTNNSGSASFSREVPPKLSRLHSAPAATATTTNSIPFKIDILPNLPTASSSSSNSTQQQIKAPSSSASNCNNFKITYKIDPVESNTGTSSTVTASAKPATTDQPVIKLDYSNLKLPMTIAAEKPKQSPVQGTPAQHGRHQFQPTIKIDLSNITNFSPASQSPALTTSSGVSVKQVPSTPTASTPSTPLSAMSSASGSSASSSSKNPYIFQHSTAAASTASASAASGSSGPAAPLYSIASSTIPGMDEDYDDI